MKIYKTKFFTLVEVMIVIAIIGIIAGIGIPKFHSYRKVAKAKKRLANIETLLTAIESYNVANNLTNADFPAAQGAANPAIAFNENLPGNVWNYVRNGSAAMRVDGEDINMANPTLDTTVLSDGTWIPYFKADEFPGGEPYAPGLYTGRSLN